MMALPRQSSAILDSDHKGGRFLIVEARFYQDIAAMLLEGAKLAFAKTAASFDVEVPGVLEIRSPWRSLVMPCRAPFRRGGRA